MTNKRLFGLIPLQIAQALIGFGAIAAFTRLMSPEEFGRYALALSAMMLAHTLVFTWAEAAAFRFFAAAKAEKRLRDHFATLFALSLALAVGALGITAGLLMLFDLRGELVSVSMFAAGAALFRFLTKLMRETERAAANITRYATAEAAYLTIGFAAGVALLMAFDLGAAAPFAGLMAAGAAIFLFDAPRLAQKAQGGHATPERITKYAGYGAPLALAIAVDLGVQTIARMLLAHESGAAELGAYAAAFGLARPVDLVFMWAGAALTPLLLIAYEDHGPTAAQKAARDVAGAIITVAAPSALGLALVAQPLANLFIGAGLREGAALALPWLALGGALSGFNLYFWSEAFQLTKRTGLRALLMLAPGVLQIALTLLLAPNYGAQGAAMASAGASIGAMALLVIVGARLLSLPLPWVTIGKVAVACALMVAAVAPLPNDYGLVSLIAKATIGALVYGIAAWALDLGGVKARASALYQALPGKVHVNIAAQIDPVVPALSQPVHARERIVYAGARDTTTPRLSILTPFFRHDPTPLIERLALQKRPVELVLLDDGSGDANLLADVVRAAEQLAFPVRIIVWGENGGRAAARNRLIIEARADYVLFLDADMIPDADDFIDRWLGLIGAERPPAAFGGLSLKQTKTSPDTKLHHVIFTRSDCRSAEARARDAAQFTAASNLLIRRDVLEQTPFDHGFSGWGWEDVDWALRASRFGAIRHIDNPATHAGLDTVETLLRKSREAGPNYARLIAKHPAPTARFASRRIASWLRLLPAQEKLRVMWSWLARDPFGSTPMLVRRTALKLYRTSIYAEHLP